MVNLAQYSQKIEAAKQSTGGGASRIPSGDYVVACVSTENKPNSKRNGHYIENWYEIQEGEYAGEKIVDRINYDNPNETARNIAFSSLKALGNAIGKTEPMASTEELIGKRILATVKNKESDRPMLDDNGDQRFDDKGNKMFYRNVNITKYLPYSAAVGSPPATVAPTSSGGSFPFPSK